MSAAFRKATKRKSKLRAGLFGPSGAGKTMTALRIAAGLGGTVGVIDSEHGSASKYSDRFEFLACDLTDKTIDGYIEAMRAAADAGVDVLIIDSMTHAWQELLIENDRAAKARHRGNTWAAWSESTPKQKRLVEELLSFPGHIIATMRSKTEWQSGSEGGKAKPVRVGMAPEQGKGIEYEFDLLLEISVEHVAEVIKDRTSKFQDKLLDKPGEDFGRALAAWLDDGEEAPAPQPRIAPETTAPSPSPDGEPDGHISWSSFVEEKAEEAAEDGITREGTPVNQWMIENHLINAMIRSGNIRAGQVETDGKRDQTKARRLLEEKFRKGPRAKRSLMAGVEKYLDELRRASNPETPTSGYRARVLAWGVDRGYPADMRRWGCDDCISAEEQTLAWHLEARGEALPRMSVPVGADPDTWEPMGPDLIAWLDGIDRKLSPEPERETALA